MLAYIAWRFYLEVGWCSIACSEWCGHKFIQILASRIFILQVWILLTTHGLRKFGGVTSWRKLKNHVLSRGVRENHVCEKTASLTLGFKDFLEPKTSHADLMDRPAPVFLRFPKVDLHKKYSRLMKSTGKCRNVKVKIIMHTFGPQNHEKWRFLSPKNMDYNS